MTTEDDLVFYARRELARRVAQREKEAVNAEHERLEEIRNRHKSLLGSDRKGNFTTDFSGKILKQKAIETFLDAEIAVGYKNPINAK